MKLTKKLETEILKNYNVYWDSYFKGDMKTFATHLDDNCHIIGSTEFDIFKNKKSAVEFYTKTADQITGKADFRNRKITMIPSGGNVMVEEFCDFYFLANYEWKFYGHCCLSTLFSEKESGWKIIYQHGSMPDSKAQEGEQIAAKEVAEENKRLRNAIKRRTVELETKNRDLEIETALERVRTVAMAMRRADDLLEICKIVYKELLFLGFNELRNVMINIHNDDKASLLNYDYCDNFGKTITDIPYNFHRLVEKQVAVTKNAQDAFFEFSFEGEELKQFRELRKSNGEQDDPKLEITDALHYYFFSIGTGSIGISTYSVIQVGKLELLKRFRNVFNLSYQRYTDISKAEAQAKESQIQLALERVRARTMAMQKSEELSDAVYILFQQFKELGENPDQATIGVVNEDEKVIEYWVTMHGNQINKVFKFPIDEPNVTNKIYNAWKKNKKSLVIDLSGRALTEFMAYRAGKGGAAINPKEKRRVINVAFFSKGLLNVQSNEERSEESIKLLERFASVFEQTYTRFLDLQKAEAQAKEAQIEAALEKVRSRSMGMQKSEELKEVIKVVYEQFIHLNINVEHTGFIIDYKERDDMHIWLADQHLVPSEIFIPYFDSAHWNSFREAKEKGTDFFPTLLDFEEKNNFYKDLFALIPGIPVETIDYYFKCPGLAGSTVLLDNVSLYIENFQGIPYTDEENNILMRFGKVFQQTYTRFLDLQKAEAQVRKAQIEAALERTRTQSMIMQHSNELDLTLRVFHEQVLLLNIPSAFSFLWLPDERKNKHLFWAIWEENKNETIAFKDKAINYPLDRNEPATAQCLIDWKSGEPVYSYAVQPEAVETYFTTWHELIDGVEKLKPEFFSCGLHYVEAFMKYGCFGVMIENDLSEDEKKILYRFAIEFERTYARFLDLQKAEAQAKEAQIEAALERVRSRTMAMQQSDELREVVVSIYEQLQLLKFDSNACNIIIYDQETGDSLYWVAGFTQEIYPLSYKVPFINHTYYKSLVADWKKGISYSVIKYSGKTKKEFDKIWFSKTDFKNVPAKPKAFMMGLESVTLSTAYFKFGSIQALGPAPLSDENANILQRLSKVFEQTYTRFLDLQKAEAQAREAEIELALERVRARTMAMQHSDELADASLLLDQQVRGLGIKTRGCAFNIYGEKESTEWFSSEMGTMPTYKTPREKIFLNYYEAGQKGETFLTKEFSGKECVDWYNYLCTLPVMGDGLKQMIAAGGSFPTRQIDHVSFFKYGYLLFITLEPVPEAHDIFIRFAKVFEQTYTRFLDLQKAEAQAQKAEMDLIEIRTARKKAEDALQLLQQTQKQLIQSEKMASLGELTAGIAHEIQNPLNFVNNFSEVNTELISELVEEVDKGNTEEVKAIAKDIKENSEKINHHGKRAGDIVKGMLQHSQSNKGQKEPTDINALCDEYLRLSYHGLRAKDKDFTAELKTDFDESVGKINVIPQEIGRVLLNLYNNAFYAVNEKLKAHSSKLIASFEPTVSISTKKINDKIEISISDNGNGIPQNIFDKIFQPFFTTKPTGQGTGLGLSLSYDIVKAHGGEMWVESNIDQGSKFIIQLPIV